MNLGPLAPVDSGTGRSRERPWHFRPAWAEDEAAWLEAVREVAEALGEPEPRELTALDYEVEIANRELARQMADHFGGAAPMGAQEKLTHPLRTGRLRATAGHDYSDLRAAARRVVDA